MTKRKVTSKNSQPKDPVLKKLGLRIRELRIKAGYSKDVFSREAGIGKYFLYRVEYGNANPSVLTLSKIANTLKVKIKDLF